MLPGGGHCRTPGLISQASVFVVVRRFEGGCTFGVSALVGGSRWFGLTIASEFFSHVVPKILESGGSRLLDPGNVSSSF